MLYSIVDDFDGALLSQGKCDQDAYGAAVTWLTQQVTDGNRYWVILEAWSLDGQPGGPDHHVLLKVRECFIGIAHG